MERDLRFGGAVKAEAPAVFDRMEEDAIGEKDAWLDDGEQENLLDASIFYDDFPPLPDFPCMSSSSSSSSAPALSKPVSSSSTANSASWMDPAALSSTASMKLPPPSEEVDCIDVMENFGYMDLIDSNEIWDPSSVLQSENPMEGQAAAPPQVCEEENRGGFSSLLQGNSELGGIFLEWLKQNKDYISAEDMRSIKLKRSTIESASKRLGSTKEGRKQLLKLILEWVEQYQLQKKRLRESGAQPPYLYEETADPTPNPNPNFIYPNTPLPNPWMPPPPVPDVAAMQMPPAFPPPPFYNPDPYPNPLPNQIVSGIPYPEYPAMEHAQSWAVSPFPVPPPPQAQFNPFPDAVTRQQGLYGNPYQIFDPNGERMMRLGSSATKEARKKRMARQRRLYSHHHRHAASSNQHPSQLNDPNLAGDGGEEGDQATSPGSWMYWSGAAGAGSSSPTAANGPPVDAPQPNSGDRAPMQPQNYQRQKQQGWKTEKNLKFLLQKVLKQSDVGNLGRIVLPKKEAESHLPELDSRDGISIAMEDIGTSRVWNMKYRFWPNNKSRMYLLENTGDFVRVNGLQEGDFIVIYSDTKCGKYMIRGVKVRQQDAKLEGKKPTRRNVRNLSLATGNTSSLAPIKQAVR